jgi:uncharacterized protein YndB with AHSA1/START domain
MSIPASRHSVVVPRPKELAFSRLTTDITSWWPMASHAPGQPRTETIVFEEEEGGRILERRKGGEEVVWGTVTTWEPPDRIEFSFHPGREESEAQVVEVTFESVDDGTRVTLVDSGWGDPDAVVPEEEQELETGWEPVLGRYAEVD